jgi:diguanylate cyclase (GGDEF)-like protein/PAS domain S-box-containing protein
MNAKSQHLRAVTTGSEQGHSPDASEVLLRVAFESAPVGIAVFEVDNGTLGRVLAANEELCRLLGYTRDKVVGERLDALLDGVGAAATTSIEAFLLGNVEHHHFEECLRREDGSLAFLSIDATRVETGEDAPPIAVVSVRDATDVHDLAARFAFIADHDLLTALLNRRGFETRLVDTLARSVRYGESGAVVLLDLDGFKAVNAINGHAAGDTLLQAVAEVLRTRLRTTDLVARVGGDEFGVMIGRVDADDAMQTLRCLLDELAARITALPGEASGVTVSAGVALFDSDHPTTVGQMLDDAEAALENSKRSGRAAISLAPHPQTAA